MKFALKLTLSIILLLAAALTLNGVFMIRANFNASLDAARRQHLLMHLDDKERLEKQTAENEIGNRWSYLYPLKLAGSELAGTGTGAKTFAIFIDDLLLYSNIPGILPEQEQLDMLGKGTGYTFLDSKSGQYMLIATPLIVSVESATLVSAHDISAIFAVREAQTGNLFRLTLLTLLIGGAVAVGFSMLLTRPLQKLKRASAGIAAGNYSERTALRADDEIGALSRSFDEMAETVERTIGELRANIENRDDFVAAFTHEIKTPMTAMLGYAAHLRSGVLPREAEEKAANYIFRETKRLEELSRKLMHLMGLREEEIVLLPFRLEKLFASLLRTLPDFGGVRVEFAGYRGIYAVGDPVLLEDLLRNLIINAAHACAGEGSTATCEVSGGNEPKQRPGGRAAGEGLVRITAGASGKTGKIRITVSDNGCGIAPEEIRRITEPFYMVDKSRAREQNGSGLGLALSVKIAELHHTRLRIESELGAGTAVSFSLTGERRPEE